MEIRNSIDRISHRLKRTEEKTSFYPEYSTRQRHGDDGHVTEREGCGEKLPNSARPLSVAGVVSGGERQSSRK